VTIGIGVLCSTKPKPYLPRPDAIAMIADTMGSTETDSTDDLHKMWLNDDLRFYAAGAGNLEYCGELISIIENELRDGIKAVGKPTHSIIGTALNKSFHILRSQHFQWDIFPHISIHTVGTLIPQEKLVEEWQRFSLNFQMLFATFDFTGQALLYLIGQFCDQNGHLIPKTVHLSEFPGCRAIGTGGENADFWLHYRRQSLSLSVKQSIYHAYEARRMAARSPTVNDNVEIAIVLPGEKSYHLTEDTRVIEGCPVSLPQLEEMFKKYGPQNTIKDLGHQLSKPSIVQKSKPEL
jgi:hypothetical protein